MIVREYEKIYSADCPNFDELRKFSCASEFFNLNWRYVQAKNYVGVIRLPSRYQIEILPKIDAPNEKLRGLVIEMLRTLKDFSCKKFLNAELDTERLPLYEIFIQIYLEMISDLVKRGLKSSYTLREENLNFFKGKLLVNEDLRRNLTHRERFFVAYDDYNIDRPEHRLIKAVLLKLRQNKLARRLLNHFDSVDTSKNYSKDFAAISIDRTNREYQAVMNWTRLILSGESFTPFIGKSEAVTLLFDMNKLFEAYVAEHIKKYFSDRFKVKIQAQEKFLFDEPKSFGLKPDIILEGDEKIILDTKWKREISPSDMYQMFAYAKKYGARKIFLLCPPQVNGNTFYRSTDFEVQIFGVDLFNMNNLRDLQENFSVSRIEIL